MALEGSWFRGKGWLLNALCPQTGVAVRPVFGVPMQLELRDLIQRWIFLGTYEPVPTRLVRAYLRRGMVVVDVEANVGYYTLLSLASVGPEGLVIAVEPSSRIRERLARGVAGIPNVIVVPSAFGERAGRGTLHVDDRDSKNDTPSMVPSPELTRVPVDVETLDGCLARLDVSRVDQLKLDIEGWEPAVLAGAVETLAAGRIRAILCEFNDYWLRAVGTSAAQLYGEILALGFRDVTPTPIDASLDTRLFTKA